MTEFQSSRLLALPYDIRFLLYQHLFPAGKYINLEAGRSSLRAIEQNLSVPTAFLKTCRFLHSEASRFLYTNYLFLIVGEKRDCLANYEKLQRTLQHHAQAPVHVHPLSNGKHSQTGAILLHVGDARLFGVQARGRGVPVTVEDLKREVETGGEGGFGVMRMVYGSLWPHYGLNEAGFVLAGIVVAVLAWLWSERIFHY
ncbi:hypothetical protein CERZMDRAFT_97347 [Cercospora zeae-maydis SCOH1-5]|uniref:Uncharacterized protein n=1 Tax=Cercospora zeae-maydis SCOH1-5 TaxID=717836 RepID=A0A6A6FI02_9PEZI|nr:hypothetical protein CERZMDRAFT_97347 [Cercospora zeae-maydis SCOH1-5]